MVADIHTKSFTSADKWRHATTICNVVDPSLYKEQILRHKLDFQDELASTIGSDDSNKRKAAGMAKSSSSSNDAVSIGISMHAVSHTVLSHVYTSVAILGQAPCLLKPKSGCNKISPACPAPCRSQYEKT